MLVATECLEYIVNNVSLNVFSWTCIATWFLPAFLINHSTIYEIISDLFNFLQDLAVKYLRLITAQ